MAKALKEGQSAAITGFTRLPSAFIWGCCLPFVFAQMFGLKQMSRSLAMTYRLQRTLAWSVLRFSCAGSNFNLFQIAPMRRK